MSRVYLACLVALCTMLPGLISHITCPQGQRLDTTETGSEVCVPCVSGWTYISEVEHVHRECSDCTKIDNSELEMVVSPCNITHDAVILCVPGYYMLLARDAREKGKCEKCTECEYFQQTCSTYNDSVCCSPSDEPIVLEVDGGDVVVCVQRSTLCGQGNEMCPDQVISSEEHVETISTKVTDGVFEQARKQTMHEHQGKQIQTRCDDGYYLHTNSSDGTTYCLLCPSAKTNISDKTDLQITANCNITVELTNTTSTELRIIGLVLFSTSLLVDVIYVIQFSRSFIRKNPGRMHGSRSANIDERIYRLVGTIGIDVHILLACVHTFGILCELGMVELRESTIWDITVVVSVVSLTVYFIDAVLFIFVKKLVCANSFFMDRSRNGQNSEDSSGYNMQAFLDST